MTVHRIFDMIDNFGDWHGDEYATALGAQFSIAEALTHASEWVPTEWEFTDSPLHNGLPEDDELAREIHYVVTRDPRVTWDHVRMAGCAMGAIVDHFKATGRSY